MALLSEETRVRQNTVDFILKDVDDILMTNDTGNLNSKRREREKTVDL